MERFYEPEEGRVLMDGKDIRDMGVQALRQRIGYITQHPQLFTGTLRDNIRLGRPGASEADIRAAADRANATPFLDAFPQGLDTYISDGDGLSGGQKQRIAIARVFLKDPGTCRAWWCRMFVLT